jgi:general secretion pathway protein L
MLDGQITKVFKETFPDTKRIVNPGHQMKVRINELKKTALSIPGIGGNGKVLDLIRDVSVRVPESADVHVSRMVVDANTVLIKGETDTFNTVDTIKKGLEPSDYFSAVTISSANLDRSGNRVKFEMKLQRAE